MRHTYTWSHLLLLAKICERVDDGDSVTATWVEIVEKHHEQTFPFTLWPLSYRTCDANTSTSISSPIRLSGNELECNYSVKMYRCNEVIIVCVQEDAEYSHLDPSCNKSCSIEKNFDYFDGNNNFHSLRHSNSKSKPLIPCNIAHTYFKMKTPTMDSLYELQHGTVDDIDSIICTGFGKSAILASCLAADISRVYEVEREFLGMDKKRICVDFFGFSSHLKASTAYWDSPDLSIDMYTTVVLKNQQKKRDGNMVENPERRLLQIRNNNGKFKMVSPITSIKNMAKNKEEEDEEQIIDYINCINRKISIMNNK